jgi:hypothetical protein
LVEAAALTAIRLLETLEAAPESKDAGLIDNRSTELWTSGRGGGWQVLRCMSVGQDAANGTLKRQPDPTQPATP